MRSSANIDLTHVSPEDHEKSQKVLTSVQETIKQLKSEYPEKAHRLTIVQQEVKRTTRFLELGNEKWVEILIAALLKVGMKRHILPLVLLLLKSIESKLEPMLTTE